MTQDRRVSKLLGHGFGNQDSIPGTGESVVFVVMYVLTLPVMCYEGCLPELKWLEHEAGHPPPPSTMVMNCGSIPSLPVYAFMTWDVGTEHLF